MAGNPIGARESGSFKAVSTAPSFNKTPVGNSTPPLPYPTTQDLSNSVSTVPNVHFNGDPVYVLAQSTQAVCKGDDAGTSKGVKSGTVNGEVKPVKGSTTVRAGKKPVVRQGDPCTMNGGNNPGVYTTTQTPSCSIQDGVPSQDTDPLVKAQSPQEKGWFGQWWDHTKQNVAAAIDDPWEGLKGAAKGIGNIPSDLGDLLIKGSTLQSAGEMEQAAAWQSLFGQEQSSQALMQAAQEVRGGAGSVQLPRFEMSNAAQAGGDTIATAATLLAGGAGLAKGAVKGAATLGKVGAAAEGAEAAKGLSAASKAAELERAAGSGAKAADAVSDAGKAADGAKVAEGTGAAKSPGDGVKVVKRSPEELAADAKKEGVKKNKRDGTRREELTDAELKEKYPDASVQREQYLRDKDGNILRDPITNEARRVDHVVVQNGKVVDIVETTSQTADKAGQITKENRILDLGGTYIRDRSTGNIISTEQIPIRIIRRD